MSSPPSKQAADIPQQHPSVSSPPTRLQHSPSLPNIWFPPHRGPIPAEIETRPRRPLVGPTPSSLEDTFNISSTLTLEGLSMDVSEIKANDCTTSDAVVKCMPALHAKKFPKRQRSDRQRTNSLLTPPLTPSSSIKSTKSTASHDSDNHQGAGSVIHTNLAACRAQELDQDTEGECTRFIEVKNVAKHASTASIRDAFIEALSEYPVSNTLGNSESEVTNRGPRAGEVLKGVFIKSKETMGIIILAFYDTRWAKAAIKAFMNPETTVLTQCLGDDLSDDGTRSWFTCRFLRMEELVQITGSSSFVAPVDGGFNLSVICTSTNESKTSAAEAILPEVRKILRVFGDIWTLEESAKESKELLFRVEYHDCRDAEVSYNALNQQSWPGFMFRAFGRHSPSVSGVHPMVEPTGNHLRVSHTVPVTEQSQTRAAGANAVGSQPHSAIFDDGMATPVASFPRHSSSDIPTSPSPTYFYTSSSYAPSVDVRTDASRVENGTAESATTGDILYRQDQVQCYTRLQGCRYCPSRNTAIPDYAPYYHAHPTPLPSIYFQHLQPHAEPFPISNQGTCSTYPDVPPQGLPLEATPWIFDAGMSTPANPYWYAAEGQNTFVNNPYIPRITPPEGAGMAFYAIPEMHPPMEVRTGGSSSTGAPSTGVTSAHQNGTPPAVIQERNQLNISRIEEGIDTRTTVMIKNIPNKMTDKDLIAYIGNVCPRKIDFLYLRMDFQNGCNVGYAFVNFIQVEDLLAFAKKRLGEKWNMFSSEKVLQMSYANYQGKEALVEKFKNSCIMDEREEWRPKIFYSSGPNIGLPEPFPPPTHLRRKERSSFNRGALYVPGVTQEAQGVRGRLGLSNSPPRSPSRYLERQPGRARLQSGRAAGRS